nr:WXG100 family type VII secretion target [Motilibacter aurantiacus]
MEAVDPVPGDPLAVQAAAARFAAMANELATQAQRLRTIAAPSAASGWEGEAAGEFRSAAEDLSRDLDTVRGRYETAASELRVWSRELDSAQEESLRALRTAQDLAADAAAAGAVAPPGQQVVPDLAAARRALDAAVAQRDLAARRAAEAIERAMQADGLKDSWLARFAGAHPTVVAWMKIASEVVAISGLALAAVAIIFMVTVPASALLALAAAGLGIDALLWLMGEGDGLSVVLGALNVATAGLAVAAGRAFVQGWNASVTAARSVGRARAESSVRVVNAERVRRARLVIARTDPGKASHVRAQQILDDVDTRVRAAGDIAAAAIGLPAGRPGLGRRLWTFDRVTAQRVASASWMRTKYQTPELSKAYERVRRAALASGGSAASGVATEGYDRARQGWATSPAPWRDAWRTVRTATGTGTARQAVAR